MPRLIARGMSNVQARFAWLIPKLVSKHDHAQNLCSISAREDRINGAEPVQAFHLAAPNRQQLIGAGAGGDRRSDDGAGGGRLNAF